MATPDYAADLCLLLAILTIIIATRLIRYAILMRPIVKNQILNDIKKHVLKTRMLRIVHIDRAFEDRRDSKDNIEPSFLDSISS